MRNISRHVMQYLVDNPELKFVEDAEQKEDLLWADKKKYISLRELEGHLFYRGIDLETALMWRAKDVEI